MAKKKSHEEEIRSGLEKLRQLSLRPEESSADTVARLQQEIGKSREMDLGIVFSLGKIIDQKAVDALAAIEKRTIDKEVKKEVRRALFKLGQRGLAAPREEAAQSTPRSSFFSSAPETEAYM